MWARLFFVPLLGLPVLAACVSAPSPGEVLATGFRTPEMTFRSFQVGVRGDLPQLEYACFSGAFRARHGLSQLGYREVRERELKHRIAYWLGIPDARIVESLDLGPGRRLLRAESHGRAFEVELVLEDFWQLWAGDELLADEPLGPDDFREISSEPGRAPMVMGAAKIPYPLSQRPAAELDRTFSEFRIGSEWKIDRFRESEPDP